MTGITRSRTAITNGEASPLARGRDLGAADATEMCVAEPFRELQAVAEHPVHPDVREPDERDRETERDLRLTAAAPRISGPISVCSRLWTAAPTTLPRR